MILMFVQEALREGIAHLLGACRPATIISHNVKMGTIILITPVLELKICFINV